MATIIMVERRVGGIHVPSYQIEDFSMDRWLVVMFSELFHPIAWLFGKYVPTKLSFFFTLNKDTKILFLLFL